MERGTPSLTFVFSSSYIFLYELRTKDDVKGFAPRGQQQHPVGRKCPMKQQSFRNLLLWVESPAAGLRTSRRFSPHARDLLLLLLQQPPAPRLSSFRLLFLHSEMSERASCCSLVLVYRRDEDPTRMQELPEKVCRSNPPRAHSLVANADSNDCFIRHLKCMQSLPHRCRHAESCSTRN